MTSHTITSIIQSFVYKCNNSNSGKLLFLDSKSMLIHKWPKTPYAAFPLDWQISAQENTVYSAFRILILCWAIDLVGKPNTTSPIWNNFHSCNLSAFTFTLMHLADTFIQSDLQYIQVIHFLSVCVFPGNWTHNLCAANTMLYHWATGTLCVSTS